jgi:hypothetical protein
MSIQEYECRDHGRTEVFLRGFDVPQMHSCPGCGKPIPHVVSAPALIDIQKTWNDKANYCRVNPYEQAKQQFKNLSDENQEHFDHKPLKITEAGLQAAAAQIDRDNRGARKSSIQDQQTRLNRKARKQNQQT